MTDKFAGKSPTLQTGPATHGFAVTPSDTVDLVEVSRSIFVGVAGNVVVIMASGQTLTFKGLSAGSNLPIRASRVLATGTTATDLVALV